MSWPGLRTIHAENLAVDQVVTLSQRQGGSIARGRPPLDRNPGCNVWRTSRWELRCLGENVSFQNFSGRITSKGAFTDVTSSSLESNDSVTWNADEIVFDLLAFPTSDRVRFTTTGDTVTLDIVQDGVSQPRSIRIGRHGILPATLP